VSEPAGRANHAHSAEGERAVEIRDLADAVRELIERMVATSAPLDVFAGVADQLREAAARFEPYPQDHLYVGFSETAIATDGGGPFDNSPLLGRANPLAPPLRLAIEGERAVGTARFGSAYEGPPGCVHGGFVAAAFDELLGLTQQTGGQPGMTGRLTVHYRRPTPLYTELRLEGTLDRVDGRKTICTGRIWAGDVLTAEAEGLFVAVDLARMAELYEQRARQTPG
jgi:acyl-coenzyme A thioesterase PaaI-like protein